MALEFSSFFAVPEAYKCLVGYLDGSQMRAELFVLPEVGQIHLNPADAVQQSLVHDGSGHRYHCQPGQTHMYVVRKQPQRLRNVFIE